jgi:predicted nuclease of restriction endonuclease-like (RecB) superfamily
MVIDRLAHDLHKAFPDMKGFSPRNLKYMRAFADAWPDEAFVQQAVARLPWGHNMVLLDRLPGQRRESGTWPRPSSTTGRATSW